MLDLTAQIDTEQVNRSLDQMRKRAKSVVSGMVNDFELLDAAIMTTQRKLSTLGQGSVFSLLLQGIQRAKNEFHKLDSVLISPEINETATASVREFTEALLRLDKTLSDVSMHSNAFDGISEAVMNMGRQLDQFIAKMGELQQKTGVVAAPSVGAAASTTAASNAAQTAAIKSETMAYGELLSELEKVSAAKQENAALMETLRVQNAKYKAAISDLNKAQQSRRTLTDEEIAKRDRLSLAYEENKVAISKLRSELSNQIKLGQAAAGSMDEMAQALSRMETLEFTREEFYRMFQENRTLTARCFENFSMYINLLCYENAHQEYNNSFIKVCNLLYLFSLNSPSEKSTRIELTQQDLSDILTISLVNVANNIARLRNKHIIVTHRKWIEIIDYPALMAYCSSETRQD